MIVDYAAHYIVAVDDTAHNIVAAVDDTLHNNATVEDTAKNAGSWILQNQKKYTRWAKTWLEKNTLVSWENRYSKKDSVENIPVVSLIMSW